jgi:hypothetical protein
MTNEPVIIASYDNTETGMRVLAAFPILTPDGQTQPSPPNKIEAFGKRLHRFGDDIAERCNPRLASHSKLNGFSSKFQARTFSELSSWHSRARPSFARIGRALAILMLLFLWIVFSRLMR